MALKVVQLAAQLLENGFDNFAEREQLQQLQQLQQPASLRWQMPLAVAANCSN